MKQNELLLIKEKCLLFNRFLIEKLGMPESYFTETNLLLEEAYLNGDIKVLKATDNDINTELSHMPASYLIMLEKEFQEKLGIRIMSITKKINKTIDNIIKRGKINSDEEWRLINEIVSDTDQQQYDVEKLNSLLSNYEMQKNS